MKKLYINYIPKIKGECTDFKIVETLKKCMQFYFNRNNIISSPGYLSNMNSVNKFVAEFKKIIPINNNIIYIGYFKSMNAPKQLNTFPLIDAHYTALTQTGLFQKLSMDIKDSADHRKMLFIYEIKPSPKFNFKKTLNLSTLNDFLDSINVNAILLGSSNQSYTTYYGNSKNQADKGETDILLYLMDETDNIDQIYVEGTVAFSEVHGVGHDPQQYLNDRLKEFLSNALQ